VTDGLHAKYPMRVRNFPPDETTLVAAAIGFSQAGLLPVLEIPYAKYLDCAADMFHEAIMAHWLSNGRQPNGMVVRLQGFDKGIFGGNFHTHNMLTMPPGLDVVCFSNGRDYVKGLRHAVRQAKAGRVVMLVDSTDLLNRRHLVDADKDDFWLTRYPLLTGSGGVPSSGDGDQDELTFDDIVVYASSQAISQHDRRKRVVIVSYGNGVPTSLIARDALQKQLADTHEVVVVDCPFISGTPAHLKTYLQTNPVDLVVFADVCKEGAGMPLGGIALSLQNDGALSGSKWKVVGATPTYNPLGNSLTFLNSEDVINSVTQLLSK
jgi:pyruvate/2-oxoglutarate/acetoin dehydrogenase E1 component